MARSPSVWLMRPKLAPNATQLYSSTKLTPLPAHPNPVLLQLILQFVLQVTRPRAEVLCVNLTRHLSNI